MMAGAVIPLFDLQGGASLSLARGLSVLGLLSLFGTLAFRVLVAPRACAHMQPPCIAAVKRRLLILAQASIATAFLGTCLWLVVQAGDFADAGTVAHAIAIVPKVVTETSFGHVILLQLTTLLMIAAALGWRDSARRQQAGLCLAATVVALQAGHSHAFSMAPRQTLLIACDALHIAGAGAWLGGLIPLLMVVRMAPPRAGASAARWFSPLGQWCLAVLLVTAAIQGWVMVASIPGLVGTAYGWMALLKTALFAILFGFAWANRYHFAPALLHANPDQARRTLVRSIGLQTVFGLAIVMAAVVLSELPPAMHIQALWPFSQRLSVAALQANPDLRRAVWETCFALAAGIASVVLAARLGRFRILAATAAVLLAACTLPRLDPLLAAANPTCFYRSPTGFTAASIVQGSALYARNCATCHGATGDAAAGPQPTASAPLAAAALWLSRDGDMFWQISHGIAGAGGKQIMPGFAGTLDDDSIWSLIDAIRAQSAGAARRQAGNWPFPVTAPRFGFMCGNTPRQLTDPHAQIVRLVIAVPPPHLAKSEGIVTIFAAASTAPTQPGQCVTRDETVAPAYAAISGIPLSRVQGTEFLIDAAGELRAVQLSSTSRGWDNPQSLQAEITALRSQHPASTAKTSEPDSMPMKMHMTTPMKMPM